MLKLRDLEEVSSIFVTHRLQDIEVLAKEYVVRDDAGNIVLEHEGDRLCLVNTKFMMLKDGNIIFTGTDEELHARRDPYIRQVPRHAPLDLEPWSGRQVTCAQIL